jgi:Putative phage metallopeptidase
MPGKTYRKADRETIATMRQALAKYHGELKELEVNVAVVMVGAPTNQDGEPTGPALTHGGARAYATVQLAKAKDRVLHPHDAVIHVDEDEYELLAEAQQTALFDHELSHLEVVFDKETGLPARHDDKRPRLRVRPDDYQLTGFYKVWERHGKDALEFKTVNTVLEIANAAGAQMEFSFMREPGPAKARARKKKLTAAKASEPTWPLAKAAAAGPLDTAADKALQSSFRRLLHGSDEGLKKGGGKTAKRKGSKK